MNDAEREEVQRRWHQLQAEYADARRDFDDIEQRHAVMVKGGFLASARTLSLRLASARERMLRAHRALRQFEQGRTT
jgi:hypothetical protein